MASTIGGQDPSHHLTKEEKDKREKKLRSEARKLTSKSKDRKRRRQLLNRALQISRRPSKRADHH